MKSDPYIDPKIAAARLITLALDRMLFAKEGYMVKWNISISYHVDEDKVKQPEGIVRPIRGTFSSGEL